MDGKITGAYVGDVKCWPFAPERLRGVWVVRFETSGFYPNATKFDEVSNRQPKVWLKNEATSLPAEIDTSPATDTRAYWIDAEGRLAQCDGWFGHQGNYPREFVIDRWHTVKR